MAVLLSKRMQAVTELVTPGHRVADVGCDHGFVSIYLVQRGISPRVIAMDVHEGPLERARQHVQEEALSSYIETRLSDGLEQLGEQEVETLILAGMGGSLMKRILTENREKAVGIKELILQPQSKIMEFRGFLRENSWKIVDETMVQEDGKYYFVLKAVFTESAALQENKEEIQQWLEDFYGPCLLRKREPVLLEYMEQTWKNRRRILDKIKNNDSERAERKREQLEQEVHAEEEYLFDLHA